MASKVVASFVDPNTAGYVLTSNATGAPTFQAAASGGGGGLPSSLTVVPQNASATYTSSDRGHLWNNIAGSTFVIYTLPATNTVGDTYWAAAQSATNYVKIQQGNSSDIIKFPTFNTAAGTSHGITYSTGGRSGTGVIAVTYISTNVWIWTGGYPFDWGSY